MLSHDSDALPWCVSGPQLVTNNSFNMKNSVLSLHLPREWSSKLLLFPYRSCLKQWPFLKCIKNINWGRKTLFNPQVLKFISHLLNEISFFSSKRMQFHGIKILLLGKRFLYLPNAELPIITFTLAVPSSDMTSTSWTVASL